MANYTQMKWSMSHKIVDERDFKFLTAIVKISDDLIEFSNSTHVFNS